MRRSMRRTARAGRTISAGSRQRRRGRTPASIAGRLAFTDRGRRARSATASTALVAARVERGPAALSIAIMIRLERALLRHAEIGRLLLGELGQFDADLGQMQRRDFLVQVL